MLAEATILESVMAGLKLDPIDSRILEAIQHVGANYQPGDGAMMEIHARSIRQASQGGLHRTEYVCLDAT